MVMSPMTLVVPYARQIISISTFCIALCIFIIGELIAKTSNLIYRLNLQVTAYGRQTVPDMGVVIQVM